MKRRIDPASASPITLVADKVSPPVEAPAGNDIVTRGQVRAGKEQDGDAW